MPHDSAAEEGWQLRFISSGLIDPIVRHWTSPVSASHPSRVPRARGS
jgi:hypothetical protein